MEHQVGVGSGVGSSDKVKKVRLVFVPLPVMGHVVSMVEFAKRLLQLQSDAGQQLDVTFLTIRLPEPLPEVSSYIASVASSSTNITFLDLPPVEQVPEILGKTPEASVTAFLDLNVPLVRSALRDMLASSDDTPVAASALVVDLFCTSMMAVAAEFRFHPYVFFTSGAGFLGLMLYASTIVSQFPDSAEDQNQGFLSPQFHDKTVDLPGFSTPFPLVSMPLPLRYPNDDAFAAFRLHATRFLQAKGVLVNTFLELEPNAIKALEEGLYLPPDHNLPPPPVYTVGPILSLLPKGNNSTAERHECIRWLDEQPPESVVFLCFGSMGAFAADQAREIAEGLEQSGHRFLWVLRSPPAQSKQHKGRRISPKDANLEELFPDGFLERTKARGLVWPSFAPQADILAHAAVGGFVTHCGWNSCLESLWFGVPMAAWPLYAEQHFNAFEMVTEMGVAVEVQIDSNGGKAVTAGEVKRAVTALMGHESVAVREKTEQMKDIGRSVFGEGGSSFQAFHKFVQDMLAAVA